MTAQAQLTEPFVPVPPLPAAPNVPYGPVVPLERGQTIVDRPRPEIDPLGVRLGSFFFFPRLEVDEAYNDNIFAVSSPRTSDYITILAPSFDLRSNFATHALNLSGGVAQSFYADHSSFNTTDAFGAADGRLDVDGEHDFHGGLRAEQLHYDPGASPNVPGNAIEPTKYSQYSGTAGFAQTHLRIGYSLDLTARRQEFEAVPGVGGVLIQQSQQNNNAYEGALRAYYEFVPNYQAFIRGAYNIRNYDHTAFGFPSLDSTGYRVDAGARIDLTGLIYLDAFAGYLKQDYRESVLSAIGGLDFGGSLVWNVTQLTSITLKAARTVQDANTIVLAQAGQPTTTAGYLETSAGLSIDHELLRNLLINVSGSYINDSFKGINEVDHYYQAGLGAKYLLNRNLYIGPFYTYQRHTVTGTNTFTAPYNRNIILLRVSTQL